MGYFSWKTADTNESIGNIDSARPAPTVYMLSPNGNPPYAEPAYEGYGRFANKDAHEYLLEMNAEDLGIDFYSLSCEERRLAGIALEVGNVYVHADTGERWHIFHDYRHVLDAKYFKGNFAEVIPELGDTPNNLIERGVLLPRAIREELGLRFPLKFSFSRGAVYEDVPASEECPYQGFFFPGEGEDE
ncbi:hypothetical protein [Marinobacter sp. F3R08]|uniref:hypothetical protein n=1 Tax=Marinobacter sp. F3R08 TaxID=2841559 RepID=UPI001C0985A7|nr:hypothetical protein [Marinobacter sp. F3R08]MBU2952257.1 hypothetical protein [Marinobacter sp. F3R08]